MNNSLHKVGELARPSSRGRELTDEEGANANVQK